MRNIFILLQCLFVLSCSTNKTHDLVINASLADSGLKKIQNQITVESNDSKNIYIRFSQSDYHLKDKKSISDLDSLMTDTNWPCPAYTNWIANPDLYNIAFRFMDKDEVIIDGQGSTLYFYGLIQPFHFENCKKVVLKNLTIDFAGNIPVSLVSINNISGDTVFIDPIDGYPIVGNEPINCLVDMDPATRQMGEVWGYSSSSRIQKSAKGFYFTDPFITKGGEKYYLRKLTAKSWLIIQHCQYRCGLIFSNCQNISYENVTIHNSLLLGNFFDHCENIKAHNLKIMPAPGRLRSINRDALHFFCCKGNIDLEHCIFEGMGDDGINCHGRYIRSIQKIDDKTYTGFVGYEYPSAGDSVEFIDNVTLSAFGSGIVKSVTKEVKKDTFKIEFTSALPKEFKTGDLLVLTNKIPSLHIANCTFKDNCARGILLQTRNVLIENCLFYHTTGAAIVINTSHISDDWNESAGVRNVVIRNNRFIDCGTNHGITNDISGIEIRKETEWPMDYTKKQAYDVHRNIVIENNYFFCFNKYGIKIHNASDVSIKNNIIDNAETGIIIDYSKNIQLTGNHVNKIELGKNTENIQNNN